MADLTQSDIYCQICTQILSTYIDKIKIKQIRICKKRKEGGGDAGIYYIRYSN